MFGSVGQPSRQSITVSPSPSTSGLPHPQMPSQVLFGSVGQPSSASQVPSLSVSWKVPAQLQEPSSTSLMVQSLLSSHALPICPGTVGQLSFASHTLSPSVSWKVPAQLQEPSSTSLIVQALPSLQALPITPKVDGQLSELLATYPGGCEQACCVTPGSPKLSPSASAYQVVAMFSVTVTVACALAQGGALTV